MVGKEKEKEAHALLFISLDLKACVCAMWAV